MIPRHPNRARMTTATSGAGTLTLGAAKPYYRTFELGGVQDGDTLSYVIEEGSNWEIGEGIYGAAGKTLTRGPIMSTNGGAAINLLGQAEVFVTLGNIGNMTVPVDRIDDRQSVLRSAYAAANAGLSDKDISRNRFIAGGMDIGRTFVAGMPGVGGSFLTLGTVPVGGISHFILDNWSIFNNTDQPMLVQLARGNPGSRYLSQYLLVFSSSVAATTGDVTVFQRLEELREFCSYDRAEPYTIGGIFNQPSALPVRVGVGQRFGSGGSGEVFTEDFAYQTGQAVDAYAGLVVAPSLSGKTFGSGNDDHFEAYFRFSPRTTGYHYLTRAFCVRGDARFEQDPFGERSNAYDELLLNRYVRQVEGCTNARTLTASTAVLYPSFDTPMRRAPTPSFIGSGNLSLDNGNTAYNTASPTMSNISLDPTGGSIVLGGFSSMSTGVNFALNTGSSRRILMSAGFF